MNWRDFNDGSEAVMVDAESLNFIWVQFLSIRITSAAATVGWGGAISGISNQLSLI